MSLLTTRRAVPCVPHACLASGALVRSADPLSQAQAATPGAGAVQDQKPLPAAHAQGLLFRADSEQKWPDCHRRRRGPGQPGGSCCSGAGVLLQALGESRWVTPWLTLAWVRALPISVPAGPPLPLTHPQAPYSSSPTNPRIYLYKVSKTAPSIEEALRCSLSNITSCTVSSSLPLQGPLGMGKGEERTLGQNSENRNQTGFENLLIF